MWVPGRTSRTEAKASDPGGIQYCLVRRAGPGGVFCSFINTGRWLRQTIPNKPQRKSDVFIQLCLMTVLMAGVPNFHHRSTAPKNAAVHPVAHATALLSITALTRSLAVYRRWEVFLPGSGFHGDYLATSVRAGLRLALSTSSQSWKSSPNEENKSGCIFFSV